MEPALTTVAENHIAPLVQDAFDEIPFPHTAARAVDGSGTNQSRREGVLFQENLLDRRLLGRVSRFSGLDRGLGPFADRDRKPRELLGRFRLVEGSPLVVGVDGGGRDDNERADEILQRKQLFGVRFLEGYEVDEDVRARGERLPQSRCIGPVDVGVLDAGRKLALAAAAHDDVPPAPLEPRDQCPPGLAAAAEKKCAPRHRRDDSSLIF